MHCRRTVCIAAAAEPSAGEEEVVEEEEGESEDEEVDALSMMEARRCDATWALISGLLATVPASSSTSVVMYSRTAVRKTDALRPIFCPYLPRPSFSAREVSNTGKWRPARSLGVRRDAADEEVELEKLKAEEEEEVAATEEAALADGEGVEGDETPEGSTALVRLLGREKTAVAVGASVPSR